MIELAVVMTVLSLIVLGTIDFGRISYMAMALTNAARAGAMYGSQPSKSGDFVGMRNAATNSAIADLGTVPTPVATRSCECQVGSAPPTVMTSCVPPVPACAGVTRMRVSVTVTKTFTMFTSVAGIPSSVVISRTAIMRAQ
jgi:Flp pilus assembly protein TadG